MNIGIYSILLITGFILLVVFQNCSQVKLQGVNSLAYQKVVALKIHHCPANTYRISKYFAYTLSAELEGVTWKSDFDRDGLSDSFENQSSVMTQFNIGSKNADNNLDGYSDYLVVKLGYDSTSQKMLPRCDTPNQDTDNDGITDCEENMYHTDPLLFDTDHDGIPDFLEIRYGLNPLDPNDAMGDNDMDGFTNLQEVQMGAPVNVTNTEQINARASKYIVGVEDPLTHCNDITVRNLPIINVSNGNKLEFMLVEANVSGDQTLKKVTVIVPADFPDKERILINQVQNQVIGLPGASIVAEPDLE